MRIAYFDCSSGTSGDMTLGALIDAGVEARRIAEAIASLGLPGCRLETETVRRAGFRAVHARVQTAEEHTHRHLHHIEDLVAHSALTPSQKDLALRIFRRLAEAEAKVHGIAVENVHFHEVGAADSIADIVGAAVGLDLLAADEIVASPVAVGRGSIEIAHGTVAVPAPGTAELLRGVPLADAPVEAELTTPTGAAILTTVATRYGPLPEMTLDRIGYGAGTRDFAERPNVLRILVGTVTAEWAAAGESDRAWVLETNLDDAPGEVVGYTLSRLLAAGALDAFTTPIGMKKNRPGVMLSVLCRPDDVHRLEDILLRETATFGVRRYEVQRRKLAREILEVATPWGAVRGKLGRARGSGDGRAGRDAAEIVVFTPEYEDCARIAAETGVPLRDVYRAATEAFDRRRGAKVES